MSFFAWCRDGRDPSPLPSRGATHLVGQRPVGQGLGQVHAADLLGAVAASGPQAAGQIKPSWRALAPMAAGKTPATGAIEPSRPSSPSTVQPESASDGMAPISAINPSAIGRS
jgi:hypothetical protein